MTTGERTEARGRTRRARRPGPRGGLALAVAAGLLAGCGTTSSPRSGPSRGAGSGSSAAAVNSGWSRFGKVAIGATVWGKQRSKPKRHPARDLIAEWLLQGNRDHRSWRLCGVDDGADSERAAALAIVARKNTAYVSSLRSGKTALEREPFTQNRLSPGRSK